MFELHVCLNFQLFHNNSPLEIDKHMFNLWTQKRKINYTRLSLSETNT